MYQWAIRPVTVLACLFIAAPGFARSVLAFTEHRHSEPMKGAKPSGGTATPADSMRQITLTLSPHYVVEETEGARTIFDFEHRRLLRLDLAKKTYEDTSLYALLGFNVVEIRNRVKLSDAMVAAGVKDNPFGGPVLIEQLFSLPVPGTDAVIDSTHTGSDTVYRWKQTELMRVGEAMRTVPAAERDRFWRWLRYSVGGHPKIYAVLERLDGVPENLRILRPNISMETIELHLSSVTTDADEPYSLDGFALAQPDTEPYPTLQLLGADAPQLLIARGTEAMKDRDTAVDAGDALGALLAHFAYSLSTGDDDVPWIAAHRSFLYGSADSQALQSALGASKREQSEAAVKTFRDLRRRTTSKHAYILDVFLGNALIASGHGGEAEQSELSALAANPYITGMWFDIGKLYFDSFRTAEAWACWDAARRIRPDHRFRQDIDGLEQRLLRDFPEFF